MGDVSKLIQHALCCKSHALLFMHLMVQHAVSFLIQHVVCACVKNDTLCTHNIFIVLYAIFTQNS